MLAPGRHDRALRRRRGRSASTPRRSLNAVEGGAILTDDDELAERLRRMRNFGFVDYDAVGDARHQREDERAVGRDGAHVARALRRLRRGQPPQSRALRGRARRGSTASGCSTTPTPPSATTTTTSCSRSTARGLRDDLIAVLQAENVLARRYFHPGCHRARALPRDASRAAGHRGGVGARRDAAHGRGDEQDDVTRVCSTIRLPRCAPTPRRWPPDGVIVPRSAQGRCAD